MRHPDTFIYRSESLEEKRSFLGAFKRYTEELMMQKRQAVESAKARQSMFVAVIGFLVFWVEVLC